MMCEVEILVQCPAGHTPHYEDIGDCVKCEWHKTRVFTSRRGGAGVVECLWEKDSEFTTNSEESE